MAISPSIEGKSIVFPLVEGFESEKFNRLKNCLQQHGANIVIASFNKGDVLMSKEQDLTVKSDVSFAQAALEFYDAVVVADNTTADATHSNVAAMKMIEETWGRGNLVATVDEGALDLIGAGIVDNRTVAAPPNLYENLRNAGAKISYTPIALSENVFSAREDADLNVFCDDIVNYLAKGRAQAA